MKGPIGVINSSHEMSLRVTVSSGLRSGRNGMIVINNIGMTRRTPVAVAVEAHHLLSGAAWAQRQRQYARDNEADQSRNHHGGAAPRAEQLDSFRHLSSRAHHWGFSRESVVSTNARPRLACELRRSCRPPAWRFRHMLLF